MAAKMVGQRLAGKTCFITGAGQGIGRSIAERFADEGARVIAADLRFAPDAMEDRRIEHLVLDVTDTVAIQAAAAASREASVLVNCVGYVAAGTLLECTPEDLDRSYHINVRSMALTIQAFLPAMLERGEGAIVNIASVVSSVMAAPNRFAYATTKAAVIGLTMAIARDYIDRGIRCNAISPGTIETPSLSERFAATGDVAAARASFVSRQPMGRLGKADEIAAAAVLLASEEATFMSGANLVIDGGMSL